MRRLVRIDAAVASCSTYDVRMAGAPHGGRRARGHRAGTLIVVGHGLHLPDDDAFAVLERPLRLGERDLLLQSTLLQIELVVHELQGVHLLLVLGLHLLAKLVVTVAGDLVVLQVFLEVGDGGLEAVHGGGGLLDSFAIRTEVGEGLAEVDDDGFLVGDLLGELGDLIT